MLIQMPAFNLVFIVKKEQKNIYLNKLFIFKNVF